MRKLVFLLLVQSISFALASHPGTTNLKHEDNYVFENYWTQDNAITFKEEKGLSKQKTSKKTKSTKKNKHSKTSKDNKNTKIFASEKLVKEIASYLYGNEKYFKLVINDLTDLQNNQKLNKSNYIGQNPSLKGLWELKYRIKSEQPLRIVYKKENMYVYLIHVFQKNNDKLSKNDQKNIINRKKIDPTQNLFTFKYK